MADFVRVPETDWQNILDATREKTGGTEKMVSGVVAAAIAGIVAGGGSGGLADSIITVETVIPTESFTNAAAVWAYVKPLFQSLESKKLCFIQLLMPKDVEAAKQKSNGFLGVYLFAWGTAATPNGSFILRWRGGDYSIAQSGAEWDIKLDSGTELYLITLDMEKLKA